MKRPASVITTLILFGLFVVLGVLTLLKNAPTGLGPLLAGSLMPLLFVIGWLGVFLKKNWARVFSTVMIFIMAFLMLALPFLNNGDKHQNLELIIFMIIVVVFMFWWAYSLCMGKASRNHFQGSSSS